MTRRAGVGVVAVALAAAALALLPAAPASAHAYVIAATPESGAVVTKPLTSVSLEFDEDVLDLGRNAIAVTAPGGRHVETACATVDGTRLTVPVALGASGRYRVSWRVTSADGHLVGDTYAFRYRAPAGAASPAATPAPAPSCGGGDAVPAAPGSAGIPAAVVIAIVVSAVVVLAVLVVGVLAVLAIRRGDRAARAGSGPPDEDRRGSEP